MKRINIYYYDGKRRRITVYHDVLFEYIANMEKLGIRRISVNP